MSEPVTVTLNIFDNDYNIVCPASESDNLHKAAQYLDQKIRDVQRSGKALGAERRAVMAALNITYELQRKPQDTPSDSNSSDEQIKQVLARVQQSLECTQ